MSGAEGALSLASVLFALSLSGALQRPFQGLLREREEHSGGPVRGAGAALRRGQFPGPGRRSDAGAGCSGLVPEIREAAGS